MGGIEFRPVLAVVGQVLLGAFLLFAFAGFVGQLAAQDFQGGGLGQFFTELQ